jgi:hypothetical protein
MKRIGLLKRRAIVLLFLDGSEPGAIARLFKLTTDEVEQALRITLRRRR